MQSPKATGLFHSRRLRGKVMAGKVNFALGFHIHQPVGNFEAVFRHATEVSYKPLILALHRHPSIPFALHVSGPVWEYIESEHSKLLELVGEMVSRGQCELLGGGFYEPILTAIPPHDAKRQLEMMSDYLYSRFGVLPEGIWLTERVWEPHLPSLLADCGVKFLAVDDYHLKAVGVEQERLFGYFITEDCGKPLAIFPISEVLRYTMPFAEVERTIEYLRSVATQGGERLVVFADDGEKFGLWPGTQKWVWQKGWMEKFLSALEANGDWLRVIPFADALEELPPAGRVYMPTGSYFEMSEWTLPPEMAYKFHRWVKKLRESGELEDLKPFVKGGFWRNFLAKYPEANWMHKRMLWVSERLRQRRGRLGDDFPDAERSLLRSQCNCAYWHGVFGGLYLPHLREGVWRNILSAEGAIERRAPLRPFISCDVDADGREEIRLSDGETALWIAPHRGGAIQEISFLPRKTNITNTLARHREGYHRLIWEAQQGDVGDEHKSIHEIVAAKESGLERLLHYDWHSRLFALDHFLLTYATADDFERVEYEELGDFVNQPYEVLRTRRKRGELEVLMERKGALWHQGRRFPLVVRKLVALTKPASHITLRYEIENQSEWYEFLFAVEGNYALLSRDDPKRYFALPHETLNRVRPGERSTFANVDGYEIVDEDRGFRLICRGHFDGLWIFPVETVSNSEAGFERIYQQTAVVHLFRFNLRRGEKFMTEIMLKIEPL